MESLATLVEIISKAGFEVRIGSLLPGLEAPTEIEVPSGRKVLLEPLIRSGTRVGVEGFDPCLVLLNNDLSDGHPEQLIGIEQAIIPPLALGWSNRLKSGHFAHFHDVAESFSELVGIDSWLISPLFRNCGEINFMKREGEDCLMKNAKALFTAIKLKYDEYGLTDKPFIVVKADAGTYGMGVMTVESPEQLLELNRKQRTRMSSAKGGQEVSRVILQEGVYTYETWGAEASVAEPVIYMIDHFVVGGFYRVHKGRSVKENLNAPGMHFEPLAFVESCNTPDSNEDPDAHVNRFYAYGVIGRLAMLAAAREIHQHG
jgi:glutamate--cysteine ligase